MSSHIRQGSLVEKTAIDAIEIAKIKPGTALEFDPLESAELAAEMQVIATEVRVEIDRKRQEELARQREVARFD